jgi:hypothetical protein
VNSNALAKHYDTLTPRERLPLILAASAREDEVERERLVRSAPKVAYRVTDFFGLALAFNELSMLHLMELLDTSALYLRALGLSDSDNEKVAGRMLDCALLYGYLFNVNLEGWRLFCAEQGFDPEICWSPLPGYGTVKMTERVAKAAAFQPEGAIAYLERSGRKDPTPPTAEGIAARLSAAFKIRADWWG